MKGFPKMLKTKEDFYNCLAMVARGELAAADLLAKIEREAEEAGREGNHLTALTLSRAVAEGTETVSLEINKTVAGMEPGEFDSLKGVLKQYEQITC